MNALANKVKESLDFLSAKLSEQPKIAIVLGSGLGSFAEQAETFNTMYNWPQQSEAYMKILQSTLNNPDSTHGS